MKLQTGSFCFDATSSGQLDVAKLLGEPNNDCAATVGQVLDGPVAIAFHGRRITAEEANETQPMQFGSFILTFDGRLDNRADLASRVGLPKCSGVSDALIVIKNYETFGEPAFSTLIGEFAFVLWCKRKKMMMLVRSACGTRRLYYAVTRDRLIWSSDLVHLLEISELAPRINEQYIRQYLLRTPTPGDTPFVDVRAVPCATLIRFALDGSQSDSTIWDPWAISPLRYRSDAEYEEHFRTLIGEAVRSKLRANGPVFAELSGGLDSSSIVLMADHILRQEDLPDRKLQTVSCLYEESTTCDESRFIHEIEKQRNHLGLYVHEGDQQITTGLRDVQFTGLPNPLHCSPGRYSAIARHMSDFGACVLLTGVGGDDIFCCDPNAAPVIADSLGKCNLLEMHQECKTWSAITRIPYLQLLLHQALLLVLTPTSSRTHRHTGTKLAPWLVDKSEALPVSKPFHRTRMNERKSPSERNRIQAAELFFAHLSAGHYHEFKQIYVSHPYSYRPLVEFCLAIPMLQFLRQGETRSLMRRALVDLLPKKIANRKSKASMDEALIRAVQREWDEIGDVKEWEVCQRGYAHARPLRDALNQIRLGLSASIGPLIALFAVERWLRSLSLYRQPRAAMLFRANAS
jgi:asparagine synthase (glutamine-hydrolysing)